MRGGNENSIVHLVAFRSSAFWESLLHFPYIKTRSLSLSLCFSLPLREGIPRFQSISAISPALILQIVCVTHAVSSGVLQFLLF